MIEEKKDIDRIKESNGYHSCGNWCRTHWSWGWCWNLTKCLIIEVDIRSKENCRNYSSYQGHREIDPNQASKAVSILVCTIQESNLIGGLSEAQGWIQAGPGACREEIAYPQGNYDAKSFDDLVHCPEGGLVDYQEIYPSESHRI